MGAEAELIAVGPYSVAVDHYMDYADYDGTPNDSKVICTVFKHTTALGSRALAEALKIDLNDYSTHWLDSATVKELFNGETLQFYLEAFPVEKSGVTMLLALADAGFEFYFRPEC